MDNSCGPAQRLILAPSGVSLSESTIISQIIPQKKGRKPLPPTFLTYTRLESPPALILSLRYRRRKGCHVAHRYGSNFNQRLKDESRDDGRVFVYDLAAFFARYGEQQIIDDRLHYLGDILIKPEYLPLLGEDLMGYVKPYRSKNRKCIVLDLDNTLWGGILGEDGFNHIDLGDTPRGRAFRDFQGHLLALHRRGIILAINT